MWDFPTLPLHKCILNQMSFENQETTKMSYRLSDTLLDFHLKPISIQ